MLLTSKPPLHGGASSPRARASNSAMQHYSPHSALPRSAPPGTQSQSQSPSHPPPSSAPAPGAPDQPVDVSQRNLPPMSSVNLPPPDRLAQMGATSHLPLPPSHQWQRTDDSIWQWLQAKAEEDRRRQEEERTRQETLKLDQRKIEQAMLRDSFQAGVPPHIVPLIFTGLGGGGGGNQQLAQQYITASSQPAAAVQGNQQNHPYQVPPTTQSTGPPVVQNAQGTQARAQQSVADYSDNRRTVPPNPYAAQTVGQPPAVQQHGPSSPPQGQYNRAVSTAQPNNAAITTTITTPTTTATAGAGTTTVIVPPSQQAGRLAQINTTEIHPYTPSPNTSVPSAASAGSVASQNQRLSVSTKRDLHQQDQPQQQSSPIHFYHWVPPNQSQPNTPASGKPPSSSPHSSQPNSHSHLRSEYQSSPKKRKAQGGHQQAPPPPSQLSESTTPQSRTRTSSRGRRGAGHARNRSNNNTPPSTGDSKSAAHSANNHAGHVDNGSSSGKNGDYDSSWPDQASTVAPADGDREPAKKDSDKAQKVQKESEPNSAREVDGGRIGRTDEDAQDAGRNNRSETPNSISHNVSSYDRGRRRSQDVAKYNVSSSAKPAERDTATEDGDPEGHLSDADSNGVP